MTVRELIDELEEFANSGNEDANVLIMIDYEAFTVKEVRRAEDYGKEVCRFEIDIL